MTETARKTTREQLAAAAEAAGWTIDPTHRKAFRAYRNGEERVGSRYVMANFTANGALKWASTERGVLYGADRREKLVEHMRSYPS
jgi:hypothetical protein